MCQVLLLCNHQLKTTLPKYSNKSVLLSLFMVIMGFNNGYCSAERTWWDFSKQLLSIWHSYKRPLLNVKWEFLRGKKYLTFPEKCKVYADQKKKKEKKNM